MDQSCRKYAEAFTSRITLQRALYASIITGATIRFHNGKGQFVCQCRSINDDIGDAASLAVWFARISWRTTGDLCRLVAGVAMAMFPLMRHSLLEV